MSEDHPRTTRPASVTTTWVSVTSAAAFIGTIAISWRQSLDLKQTFLVSMAVFMVVQMILDFAVRKVHKNATTGLVFRADHFRSNFSLRRSLVKLGGLYATLAVMSVFYLLIPMYWGYFHEPFWDVLRAVAPYVFVLTIPYFILIDALMADPRDGYWHAAQLVSFRWSRVDWKILREYAKGWTIKGFFLPLMTPLLIGAINRLPGLPTSWSIVEIVALVAGLVLCLDLGFVVLGYTFTVRILDSHIRSANPFVYAWIACLICYRPFWAFAGPRYNDGVDWSDWFAGSPVLLVTWGILVIAAKSSWAWSNMMFGFRFSNLTHRGIITSGPFRFTKHPSYVSKNIAWWLISVPFLSRSSPLDAVWFSAGLMFINTLYFVRAISEEAHLSEDPTYVAYAEWINEHGLFRWVGRAIPILRYRAPKVAAVREAEQAT